MIHSRPLGAYLTLCRIAFRRKAAGDPDTGPTFALLGLPRHALEFDADLCTGIHAAAVEAHLPDVPAEVIGDYPQLTARWYAEVTRAQARAAAKRMDSDRASALLFWQARGKAMPITRIMLDGARARRVACYTLQADSRARYTWHVWLSSDLTPVAQCQSAEEAAGLVALLEHHGCTGTCDLTRELVTAYGRAVAGEYQPEILPSWQAKGST